MKEQQTSVEKDHEKLLDLNWFPQTVMSPVVITTPLAERFPATPQAAVGTDRRYAVRTFSRGSLAARRSCVAVTGYVFESGNGHSLPLTECAGSSQESKGQR